MSFVLPPEVNSALMHSGAGSAPMLAAASAWEGLASELETASSSFSSITSNLVGQAWQGPASAAMAAAAAPYAGWLSAATAQAQGAAGQARSVAAVFEAARTAIVHPLVVAANRNAFVRLVVSNWFGFNAPAIMAAEAQYEQMWAHDVSTMVGYYGQVSAAAAQLTPWQGSLPNLGQAASATAANFPFNLGVGNKNGNGNVGNGNNGNNNIGGGNRGDGNIGGGNTGIFTSVNPNGGANVGFGNTGNNNIGAGNAGVGNVGFGNASTPGQAGNFGLGNTGNGNQGFQKSATQIVAAAIRATTTSVPATPAMAMSASATMATTTSGSG